MDTPQGKALAIFTTPRRALAYVEAAGLPTDTERWTPFTLPLHMAEEYIREDSDSEHVVIDPLPDGKRGRRLTIFQAIVELS